MRKPKFISPSSLARWEDRREEFYKIYLSDVRTEREPQVNYMATGSAFDAFVKSQIHSDIFGKSQTEGGQFDRQKLFEDQVEEHIRDEVWEMATFLWDQYQLTGAYAALLADIVASPYAPEMEFTVKREVNGVPIMGKPDLRYVTKQFVHVVCDWKVNGSYSNYGVSPVQGFQISRFFKKEALKTETHKKYLPITYKDVEVNQNTLDTFSKDWATQLSMYAWCLGEEPGDEEYVVRMEQIAVRPRAAGGKTVKCVTHMSRIPQMFQLGVMKRIMDCWNAIETGHIFTDLTLEQSIEHCELIDRKLQIPLGLHPVMNEYLVEKGPRFK